MLSCYLNKRSPKRALSAQPFIDHDPHRRLIAGWPGLSVDLLRGHVRKSASHLFGRLRARTLSKQNKAKIAQQNKFIVSYQQILSIDIATNQPSIMSILQCRGSL